MNRGVLQIRVSLQTRRLFDQCFAFRGSIRTVSDCSANAKAEEWNKNLDAAVATRLLYQKPEYAAKRMSLNMSAILDFAVMWYEYARRMSINCSSEQKIHEWLAEKKDTKLG